MSWTLKDRKLGDMLTTFCFPHTPPLGSLELHVETAFHVALRWEWLQDGNAHGNAQGKWKWLHWLQDGNARAPIPIGLSHIPVPQLPGLHVSRTDVPRELRQGPKGISHILTYRG